MNKKTHIVEVGDFIVTPDLDMFVSTGYGEFVRLHVSESEASIERFDALLDEPLDESCCSVDDCPCDDPRYATKASLHEESLTINGPVYAKEFVITGEE